MGCLDAVRLRMENGKKHRGLIWIESSFLKLLLSRAREKSRGVQAQT